MQSVSSSGVYNHTFPDFSQNLFSSNTSVVQWTATEDCYVYCSTISAEDIVVYADGKEISCSDNSSGMYVMTFAGFFKKGTVFTSNTTAFYPKRFKAFKLI